MRRFSFLLICLVCQFSISQQFSSKVIVNSESLNQTNNSVFKNLEQSIIFFVDKNQWSNDNLKDFEKIKLNILITINKYEDGFFNADFEFQAFRPVLNSTYLTTIFKYVDKNIQFSFNEFDQILFSENQFQSNLSSLLAFYLNIVIGIDKDSYVYNSGEFYFNKSKNILNLANQKNNSGWSSSSSGGVLNKFWLIDNLSSPNSKEFKDFIFNYHSNGLDLMHNNLKEAKNNIITYLSYLKPLKRRSPNSILLKILFDAKSDEINEIFLGGPEINTEELVNDLNYLSPFFSNKWNSL
ncbi:MAG: DUF4835 family protein [Flavobacteriaceae bacterium]|jgi:hypothetical protein|nr:DUF4835 family protein [Flavobacteriaceae bacterium]